MQKLVALVQMTYPGAPMIYYGDECGMWGANDPCNRKPMVWPDFEYEPETAHPHGKTRPADDVAFDTGLRDYYRILIRARRESPALSHGEFQTLLADDDRQVVAFARAAGDDEVVVVINNGPVEVKIPWRSLRAKGEWKGLLTGQTPGTNACVLPPVSGDIFFPSGVSGPSGAALN